MLRIRPEQMAVWRAADLWRFEEDCVEFVRASWPEELEELGEEEVRAWARQAMERTALHGIPQEQNVLRYLNLMLLLGRDFDRSEELPWAAALLAREDLGPSDKLEELEAAADEHLSGGES